MAIKVIAQRREVKLGKETLKWTLQISARLSQQYSPPSARPRVDYLMSIHIMVRSSLGSAPARCFSTSAARVSMT